MNYYFAGVPAEIAPDKVRQQLYSNPIFEIDSANRIEDNEYIIHITGLK